MPWCCARCRTAGRGSSTRSARGGAGFVTRCRSPGPLGRPVLADYLMTDDGTAWIESATAAGLHLVPSDQRDPTRTTSRGVGELMLAALDGGARRIVVGVGGTGHLRWGSGAPGGAGCYVPAPGRAVPRWRPAGPHRGRRSGPGAGCCRRVRPGGRHRRRRAAARRSRGGPGLRPAERCHRRAGGAARGGDDPLGDPAGAQTADGRSPQSPSAPARAAGSGRRSSGSVPVGSRASAPCSRPPTSPGSSGASTS